MTELWYLLSTFTNSRTSFHSEVLHINMRINRNKNKKGGYELLNNAERETEKEVAASRSPAGEGGGLRGNETLDLICDIG